VSEAIKDVLEKVYKLYVGWGLIRDNWVLVDEYAFLLQGYDVKANEVRTRHIDTLIEKESWPWHVYNGFRGIPPIDSKAWREYEEFRKETGHELDFLIGDEEMVRRPRTIYKLPNGKEIWVMKPLEMVKLLYQYALKRLSKIDVGKEKLNEWWEKVKIIKIAAIKKGDEILAEYCRNILKERVV